MFKRTDQMSEKQALSILFKACQANDAAAIREALMNWLRKRAPGERVVTLGDACRLLQSEELSRLLMALDRSLYGPQGDGYKADGEAIHRRIQEYLQSQRKTHHNDSLQPFYAQEA